MEYRIHASFETWKQLMKHRPHMGGGCKTPRRESASTCVTTDIDQSAKDWLEANGVRVELIKL